jgi:ubiquinone/menaquinone biosynthesis C-methylase UbiE
LGNYDTIAPFYDRLKRLIFGSQLDRAESYYLDRIGPNAKVLILGGGSGSNLNLIDQEANITFVELSQVMIKKARIHRAYNVRFVNTDFLHFENGDYYDWIICPFFLDVFAEEDLDRVIKRVSSIASSQASIIVTDFQSKKIWHRIFSFLMYVFFKLVTNMKPLQLLNIHKHLKNNFLRTKEESFFMSGFIFSRIYSIEGNHD